MVVQRYIASWLKIDNSSTRLPKCKFNKMLPSNSRSFKNKQQNSKSLHLTREYSSLVSKLKKHNIAVLPLRDFHRKDQCIPRNAGMEQRHIPEDPNYYCRILPTIISSFRLLISFFNSVMSSLTVSTS